MRFDTVIFDLDGTLLYTLEGLHRSINFALRGHGLPELTMAETRRFVGNGSRKLVERAVKGAETDTEAVHQTYCAHYSAHAHEGTRPYEGIPAMLAALRAAGIKTGVVSNKPDGDAVPLIRQYFGDLIAVTIGKKPEYDPKPDPRAVWEAMDKLGADRGRTLYVGDSDVDFFTAQNAGIPAVLVSWGYRDMDELEGCGALAIAHSVKELSAIIEEKEE
ncbi:MAG: HAD-IA family hydrolase [Oscillospiraceae bacterium]|nr:HAD-IA family hydrolase [Oscillospiraceae bacterium]